MAIRFQHISESDFLTKQARLDLLERQVDDWCLTSKKNTVQHRDALLILTFHYKTLAKEILNALLRSSAEAAVLKSQMFDESELRTDFNILH
jgi:hypothetical protein